MSEYFNKKSFINKYEYSNLPQTGYFKQSLSPTQPQPYKNWSKVISISDKFENSPFPKLGFSYYTSSFYVTVYFHKLTQECVYIELILAQQNTTTANGRPHSHPYNKS